LYVEDDVTVNGTLNVAETILEKYGTISATTTLTVASPKLQLVDVTAGTYTVTLPSTATITSGYEKEFIFKDITSVNHVLYLDPAGSQTIDGATHNNEVDAQYDCLGIVGVPGKGWVITERRIQ